MQTQNNKTVNHLVIILPESLPSVIASAIVLKKMVSLMLSRASPVGVWVQLKETRTVSQIKKVYLCPSPLIIRLGLSYSAEDSSLSVYPLRRSCANKKFGQRDRQSGLFLNTFCKLGLCGVFQEANALTKCTTHLCFETLLWGGH